MANRQGLASAVPSNEIRVATEFSMTPGGRYHTDGPDNGEDFREKTLLPALAAHDRVDVYLDGTRGYPSSFLDEAFAGAARKLNLTILDFKKRVNLIASPDYQIYVDDIYFYVENNSKKKR